MGKWSDRQSAKDVILTRYIDRRRFFWKLDVWCTQSCMGSARTCMRASINQAYEPMPVPVIWKPLLIESVVCSQTNAFQSLTVEQYHSCIVCVFFYFVSRTFSPFLHCHLVTFLPARRYASAGNSDRNVSVRLSVRPSVRHAPVLCQNEESQRHNFFTIWQPQDSSFPSPNFVTKF